MARHVWGDVDTRSFAELRPESVLLAAEAAGRRPTGRVLALNSLENRVFEIEVEPLGDADPLDRTARFVIAKFYRPGRWSREQILDEHRFLQALDAEGIPVAAPLTLERDDTLQRLPGSELQYAVFPRHGGRIPDEVTPGLAERLGALVARVHNVGARLDIRHRLTLDVETFGWGNLDELFRMGLVPDDLADDFEHAAEQLLSRLEPALDEIPVFPIHGDCHLANILWRPEGLSIVDFDDMVIGPAVQDLWLLIPGTDAEARQLRQTMLAAYAELREWYPDDWRVVEGLRGMRYIHFAAWIGKRWADPTFAAAFPLWGSERWWRELIRDLEDQDERLARDLGAS